MLLSENKDIFVTSLQIPDCSYTRRQVISYFEQTIYITCLLFDIFNASMYYRKNYKIKYKLKRSDIAYYAACSALFCLIVL